MAEAPVPMANHHAISDEQQIAAAVAAAALPAEHDELLGGQGEEHPAISLGDVWEAPLFAETVTSDGNGPAVVSTENILAWCKPEFKGLNIYFSDKYKPSDEASWIRLKTDLQASAMAQGFSLVSKGSKGKSAADKLRQVLVCGRGRVVPHSRKTGTSMRPTDPAECCRFRLTIHQDVSVDRFYVKGGQNNPNHKFHDKMDEGEFKKKKRARDSTSTAPTDNTKKPATDAAVGASNVVWHATSLTRADRWKHHKGAVIWFTGLSASGKSTIANAVEVILVQRDVKTYLLDGDNLRHGLCAGLGFTAEDRLENLRRTAEVAALMADAGMVVLAAFVSPLEAQRQRVKDIVGAAGAPFVEVYVKTSLSTCEARDPKGLYVKARAGTIPNFTGISDPYEEPTNPDVTLDADTFPVELLASQVVQYLDVNGTIKNGLSSTAI
jgi:adenylylsulfate kinase